MKITIDREPPTQLPIQKVTLVLSPDEWADFQLILTEARLSLNTEGASRRLVAAILGPDHETP